MRQIDSIRCLVLIPLGHTIVHFPHNIQLLIILNASSSLPLCRQRRTFLTLIPENSDAGQVALQDPQDIHLAASGSMRHKCSNRLLSIVSRFIAELGDILNPKILISYLLLFQNVSQVRRNVLLQAFRVQSSARYTLLRSICLYAEMKLYGIHCRCFEGIRRSL